MNLKLQVKLTGPGNRHSDRHSARTDSESDSDSAVISGSPTSHRRARRAFTDSQVMPLFPNYVVPLSEYALPGRPRLSGPGAQRLKWSKRNMMDLQSEGKPGLYLKKYHLL